MLSWSRTVSVGDCVMVTVGLMVTFCVDAGVGEGGGGGCCVCSNSRIVVKACTSNSSRSLVIS